MVIEPSVLFTSFLAFLTGILAPMLIERWRGGKAREQKLLLLDSHMSSVHNSLTEIEKRLSATEERIRLLEVNIAEHSAILKFKVSEAPTENIS